MNSTELGRLLEGGPPAWERLGEWMAGQSRLPGPRANLELGAAFAAACAALPPEQVPWPGLLHWTAISADEAPVDDPRMFLPFSALLALGALFARADAAQRAQILGALRMAMSDTRWRIREGAVMGFERIAAQDVGEVLRLFGAWSARATLLEWRGMIAVIAHPDLLTDLAAARFGLELSDRALRLVAGQPAAVRTTESFRVLRQGLEYAVSVVVAALPGEGFTLLQRWAASGDADVRRIVASNLKKARLVKAYPEEVRKVGALLGVAGG